MFLIKKKLLLVLAAVLPLLSHATTSGGSFQSRGPVVDVSPAFASSDLGLTLDAHHADVNRRWVDIGASKPDAHFVDGHFLVWEFAHHHPAFDLGHGLDLGHDWRPGCIPAVPEPGSYALMGLGLAGVALVKRRRQSGSAVASVKL